MNQRHFTNHQEFVETATAALAAAVSRATRTGRTALLAVPGGSTARAVLPRLAAAPLPWEQITLTLTDERWVAAGHPDSNEGLVRELLGPAAGARICGLYTGAASPADAVAGLGARLGTPDIVLLGMGEDGHIASLFPGDAANEASAGFAAVARPDHCRVTLTPPALAAASDIMLAFCGTAKSAIFETAKRPGPARDLPVRHVLSRARIFIGP